MICCWIENPNSKEFKQHLPRIHDFLWLAEDGMKAKVLLFLLFKYKKPYILLSSGKWNTLAL